METTEGILSKLADHEADLKVVSSDLNFGNCYCRSPSLQFKPLDYSAPELFSSFNFHQLIDIPTRISLTTVSLIDLIYVNTMDLVEEFGTLPQIADHDGTLLCLNIKQKQKIQTQKTIFDYKNADLDGLTKFIKEFDFENTVFSLPVKDQAERYSQILIDGFNNFVPKKVVYLKPQSIPWCNSYTRLLLRKKNRNYKFFKQVSEKFSKMSNDKNTSPVVLTQLLLKKEKVHSNFKIASKESQKANRRAKNSFYNAITLPC